MVSCEPKETTTHDGVRTEAGVPSDVDGVAIFWLEHPGPYLIVSTLRDTPYDSGCWW